MAYCPRQSGPAFGQTPRLAGWLAAGLLAVALLVPVLLPLLPFWIHLFLLWAYLPGRALVLPRCIGSMESFLAEPARLCQCAFI